MIKTVILNCVNVISPEISATLPWMSLLLARYLPTGPFLPNAESEHSL